MKNNIDYIKSYNHTFTLFPFLVFPFTNFWILVYLFSVSSCALAFIPLKSFFHTVKGHSILTLQKQEDILWTLNLLRMLGTGVCHFEFGSDTRHSLPGSPQLSPDISLYLDFFLFFTYLEMIFLKDWYDYKSPTFFFN